MITRINPSEMNLKLDTIYDYNGIPVPRVTNILSSMLHEEYLMGWANYIGLKGEQYRKTLNAAAVKGTYTHNAIEKYVQNGTEFDSSRVPENYRYAVNNAYLSFLKWWEIITQNNYRVIMQEEKLVGKYFAGTLDLLIEINGLVYLMDFKTSNHPSFKYFLQLSAYIYLLKELYNIDVDGCGIIMLSKDDISFNEIILNDIRIPGSYNNQYMKYCEETFLSLAYAFYNRSRVESMFKEVIKNNESTIQQ